MGVSKVIYNTENGAEVLMDLTGDTVTPDKLARGATAHGADGNLITGTATEVNVVQTTGSSTTDVMSQAAVTNEVGKLSKEIVDQRSQIDSKQPMGNYLTEIPDEYITKDELEAKFVEGVKISPLFVSSIEECTDTTKLYVLPDGFIYAYMYQEGSAGIAYTNQIPISTDKDGNIYNGTGYNNRNRINSSGAVVAYTNYPCSVTGFIPVKQGDVVRFQDAVLQRGCMQSGSCNTWFYDASKKPLFCTTVYNASGWETRFNVDTKFDEDNIMTQFTVDSTNGATISYIPNIAYIRFSLHNDCTEDSIITVNEEIKETIIEGGYQWVNTGREFGTVTVEVVENVDSMTDTTKKYINAETGTLWAYYGKYIEATAGYYEGWYDTGIVYNGSDAETLSALETRVTKTESDIVSLQTEVKNLKENGVETVTTDIPSYWKEAVDALEDTILAQLDEGGIDSFGFVWGADIHGKNGYKNSSNGAGTSVTKNIGHVSQYATDKYDLPFVMFSGDIMSQASHSAESNVHDEHEAMWEIFAPIDKEKILLEKGNHDGAYGASVDGVYYLYNIGGKEVYNNLFRRQALDRTRVFGGDGSYFYVDTPKMRVIMLNGHTDGDGSVDANGYAVYNSMKHSVYGTEQLQWLADVALNVPEGTRIILSAHQPLNYSRDGASLVGLLNAYNNKTTYSNSINLETDYWGSGVTSEYNISTVSADFTNAKGKVVAYFNGHIHKDSLDTTSYSFVTASITTAGADVRDTNPVERVAGTATETALDIVIITKDKIYFNRLGAGANREADIK